MKQRKPFYSIGIIFKNEIRCLERCLKSLQPLRDAVPCEVVMADTGSTDGSREVAEKYADVLFDFPWVDDFSAARNAVMDRCGGEWYFSIDADEWLDGDVHELVEYSRAKKLPRDFASVVIRNYKTQELEKGQHYVDFSATRLARLSTGMRFTGAIHEAWLDPNGEVLIVSMLSKTMLHHDGYVYFGEEEANAKRERNMKLLRKKLEESPEDLQTLVECMDSARDIDQENAKYARQAIEGVRRKWKKWDVLGAVIFRDAIGIATEFKLPELQEWLEEAFQRFPDSIFTRVDVNYYALVNCWGGEDYEGAVRHGELYQQGVADYKAERYDLSEFLRGVIEYASPHWERRMAIMLTEAYLNCNQPEKAYDIFQGIKGEELNKEAYVEACANMLLRLQRITWMDLSSLAARFWEAINQPVPTEELARKRREVFYQVASRTFVGKYRREEEEREDFLRYAYTVCAEFEEECGLKLAAEMLDSQDPAFLAERLDKVEKWEEFPVQALSHALSCGVEFPLPGKPLTLETMDDLAKQLAWMTEDLPEVFLKEARNDFGATIQRLTWVRGIGLVIIRGFGWDSPDSDPGQGVALAESFAKVEGAYLERCYTPEMLRMENLPALPALHRFGWYCARAFQALGAGDAVGYVRLLRAGLDASNEMKPMVEFLLKHTPELHQPEPSEELRALAEQIRTVLSRFTPDDPTVAALKQSEAYRKVAHLIEGLEVPVVGGLVQ